MRVFGLYCPCCKGTVEQLRDQSVTTDLGYEYATAFFKCENANCGCEFFVLYPDDDDPGIPDDD